MPPAIWSSLLWSLLPPAIAQPPEGPRPSPCRRLRARVIEGVRYPRAPRELRRLDDGDPPGLAHRHAREEAGRAQQRVARRKPQPGAAWPVVRARPGPAAMPVRPAGPRRGVMEGSRTSVPDGAATAAEAPLATGAPRW